MKKLKVVLFLFLVSLVFSCGKTDTYPDEPIITFKSLEKFTSINGLDTALRLTFSFTDGDGDIGLKAVDTLPPYNPGSEFYYNFFLKYYKKENGVFNELVLLFPPNQRIPFIYNESNNKALTGEILLDIELAGLFSTGDTFRFEASIADRALHKSNTIQTSEVVLTTQ